ncbi:tail protein from Bacteriophage (fragment) [Escherichia coli]|uniref:Tail protein from Bacteriophage n=1 Tax=Escherichia coli TaxID=562 RepID=A0A2X1NJA2_ECOLX
MLPSETMIWQPEFTDKTLSRKPGAVQFLDKIITIHRVKQVVTASLKLRDYDGQVAEAMPHDTKMTKAEMSESVCIT